MTAEKAQLFSEVKDLAISKESLEPPEILRNHDMKTNPELMGALE